MSKTTPISSFVTPAARRGLWRHPYLLPALLIVILTLLAYWQLPNNLFVVYDDPEYITENANVLGGITLKGIAWAFTAFAEGNWHPVTWLSHMLDVQLFGLNPAGHHGMALFLHLANALLVLLILGKMTGAPWRSAMVALLFALHPLHVESVAWAAERKDLLCALFWLLTMQGYLAYIRRPGWRRYLLVMVPFALALMAKPMAVTLPCALLLLDYWPLGRFAAAGASGWPRALGEKVPLLVLSALSCLVTYYTQTQWGAVTPLGHYSALYNAGNAIQAYVGYLAKTFYPADLAIIYPFDVTAITPGRTAAALLLLMTVTFLVFLKRKNRPYLVVGWFWFLGTLVPVIGFVRVGSIAMADRYTYLPLIGIFIMLVWGVADLTEGHRRTRRVLAGAAGGLVLLLALLTAHQVRYWHNGIVLMEHALTVTSGNWFALNNLGAAHILIGTGNRMVNISASLPIDPITPERRTLHLTQAVALCRESLRIEPTFPLAHFNLGLAHLNLGDRTAATAEYRALLPLDPRLAGELGTLISRAGLI